jgi:hypothetical protein
MAQGNVGLYLLGTKSTGEVAAYYQFPLVKGKDINTTTGAFLTTSTGFAFGVGMMTSDSNYQIVLDPNFGTNKNGILYIIELTTGYTMKIMEN